MSKFKVGDKVKIVRLVEDRSGRMPKGTIGHIGIITDIEPDCRRNGDEWHYLEPYCIGGSWPENCLDYYSPQSIVPINSIDDLFESKLNDIWKSNKEANSH